MEKIEYIVWLSQMKYICFEDLQKLLGKYKCFENIWNISSAELESNNWLTAKKYEDLINSDYKKNIYKLINNSINKKIEIIPYYEKKYPNRLKYIQDRPICLYFRGNLDNLNNESVAIVGSRNISTYGIKNAKYFSLELSKRKVNIISGLARGVDAIAHEYAIRNNSKTVAVIGNGLDIVYPKENLKLAEKILDHKGLIISEYVIGTKPERENFPRRNRIISGLSDAIIIVEASNKSGALITANYGIDQGKEVWAIPGNIDSYNSQGTNQLIKDGANVLTCVSDIIY